MSNSARIVVLYPGAAACNYDDSILCVVGHDIEIRPQLLQDYCAKPIHCAEHDLVVLAGAVSFADRIVPRRRATGWLRELHLTVPVHEPERWNDRRIQHALVEVLQFVTGDAWTFSFVPGGNMSDPGQSSLNLLNGPFVVIPFSDGLDSFLQWQLTSLLEPGVVPLRIQTSTRSRNRQRDRQIELARGRRDQVLQIPVRTSVGNHPEPSYRARTFLFYTMAALAAAKTDSTRILIGENGIGSLGPSLIPYGNEVHHRTTHPGATSRLAGFINAVLDTSVKFEHPQLRWTKGEVLTRAISDRIRGWECTHSCVRGPRDRLNSYPCGICSGCLLRRQSLHTASQPPAPHFWNDLSAPGLDESRLEQDGRQATKNDKDIWRHAVHGMDALAELSRLGVTAAPFQRLAWELSNSMSVDTAFTAADVHRLISAHASEWWAFRQAHGDPGLLYL
jgi:7-cyano-7-deazaguanine synthase in queuosine biosynthesis